MMPLIYCINGSLIQSSSSSLLCFLRYSLILHFVIYVLKNKSCDEEVIQAKVNLCRSAKHAAQNATRKTQLYLAKLRRKKKIGLMAESCWPGSWKILHSFFWFFSFWKLIPVSASSLRGMPGEGEEGMEFMRGMVANWFTCWLRLVKKSWSFSAVWFAAWRYGCTWSLEQTVCICVWKLLD